MAKEIRLHDDDSPFWRWWAEVELGMGEVTPRDKAVAIIAFEAGRRTHDDAERLLGAWRQRAREQQRKALITCTRRLEWDAAHRIPGHEGACADLHGHRYAAEITCAGPELDRCGRVVDFGEIKMHVGAWIDANWDHATILHDSDELEIPEPVYRMSAPPTAEGLARELATIAQDLLAEHLTVVQVRLQETPNCWATWCL